MRKRIVRIWDIPAGGILPSLAVLAGAFALGGLLGCLLASRVGGGGNDSLTGYLQAYLGAVQNGAAAPPHLLVTLWETFRWPLCAFLMGFTALGVVGLPVLFAVRGFLLSFAISSFVRMFGGVGGILAFFAFGLTALVAIPALFVLGVQGFAAAKSLAGRFFGNTKCPLPFGRLYLLRSGVCALALGVCVLLEYLAVPALLGSVAGLF